MKIAVWNCRALGNNPAIRGLLNFQKSKEVDILFLSQTKLDEKRMKAFKQKLHLGNLVAVDAVGKGGNCCVVEGWY
jgi:exonuclease III